MRYSNVTGGSTRGPGELGWVPLEHLPLRVDIGVHRVVVDADRGKELPAWAAEAADERGVLVREVNPVVELEVGVGIGFCVGAGARTSGRRGRKGRGFLGPSGPLGRRFRG